MEAPKKEVLSVEWDPASGALNFNIPSCGVYAAGLLAFLEAVIKIRCIAPSIAPAIAPATQMPHLPPKLN